MTETGRLANSAPRGVHHHTPLSRGASLESLGHAVPLSFNSVARRTNFHLVSANGDGVGTGGVGVDLFEGEWVW